MKFLAKLLFVIYVMQSPNALAYRSHNNKVSESRADTLQGYNWYSEQQNKDKEAEEKLKEEVIEQNTNLPEYEQNIRDLQTKLYKAHRRALDNPTTTNLLEELKIEKEMMYKSQIYGERKVAVAMMGNEFINMKSHSNVLHRSVQDKIDNNENFIKLVTLSEDWGLILQVERECQHCHAFAPIILEFAQKYGFELLAATDNGEDFENIEGVKDNGEMEIFNPHRETPILYLVKSDGQEVLPISRGINSEEQIIINIMTIDKHLRKLF